MSDKKMIQNARIEKARLGFDRDVFASFSLTRDYGGSFQGFGGFVLDDKRPEGIGAETETKPGHLYRPATAYGMEMIYRILRVVGVDDWSKLAGQHIRVERKDTWNGEILRIGHIVKDVWLDPREIARAHGIGDDE